MSVIVSGLQRADAREALNGVPRSPERLQRDGAIVMRRGVLRLGRDRIVEKADGGAVLALRRGKDAQVVGDGGVSGRNAQRVAVGRFGLIKAAVLVMGYRVGDQLIEFARQANRHWMAGEWWA